MSESKEMDLRAFLYKSIKQIKSVVLILICVSSNLSFCFGQKLGDKKVPYEIKFADVVFQFNDVSRFLLSQEITALTKNLESKQENLDKLSLILPVVDPILQKANIHSDFKFLSTYTRFQKSVSINVLLDNNVFWCLDLEKSRDVSLLISKDIDERKHIVLATNGAVGCLKKNQAAFGNMGSVLMAHLASKEVVSVLDIKKKWSGKFIAIDSPAYSSLIQFLAYKWFFENELKAYKNNDPKIIYEYFYGKGRTLNVIAADLKVEPKELVNSNLWLKSQVVPESITSVLVVVPASKFYEVRSLAENSKNKGVSESVDLGFPVIKENFEVTYGRGGSFFTINNLKGIQAEMCDNYVNLAFKANINYDKFLEYNDMTDKDLLTVGQIYYVEPKFVKATIPHHIVKNEESLWDISQIYGVKLISLLKFNRMETITRLQRGRVVYIQDKRPKDKAVEYVEFPLNETQSVETKSEDDVLAQYVSFESETSKNTPETLEESKFDSNVMKRNPDKEVVRREVKTKPVEDSRELYSEGLKQNFENKKPRNREYLVHEVKKGETLYRLSVNYKVSVDQLYKLNNLTSNDLEVGDKIIVKKY